MTNIGTTLLRTGLLGIIITGAVMAGSFKFFNWVGILEPAPTVLLGLGSGCLFAWLCIHEYCAAKDAECRRRRSKKPHKWPPPPPPPGCRYR